VSDPFNTAGTYAVAGGFVGLVLWLMSLLIVPLLSQGAGGAVLWVILFVPLVVGSAIAGVMFHGMRRNATREE